MAVAGSRSFLALIARNNPFYLLSAACMLQACLLLTNTTTWSPIALNKLVVLSATLNLYELMLVGLGLLLVVHRGRLVRDAVMLLVLEAFFLADVGFINSEIYQESLRAGLIVNGLCFVLAIVKLVAIFRVLGMPIRSPAFATLIAGVGFLLIHPAVLKYISDEANGHVAQQAMYAMWWLLSFLMVAYGMLLRWSPPVQFRGRRVGIDRAGIGHVLMCILIASLIAHLGTAHWVYKSPFVTADLSPVLLGLTAIFVSVRPTPFFTRDNQIVVALILALSALLTSASNDVPAALNLHFIGHTISPLMLIAAATYLLFIYAFAIRYVVPLCSIGIATLVGYIFAPSWDVIEDTTTRSMRWLADLFLPRTQAAWGAISMVGAFALLALGGWVSLNRTHPEDEIPRDGSGGIEPGTAPQQ